MKWEGIQRSRCAAALLLLLLLFAIIIHKEDLKSKETKMFENQLPKSNSFNKWLKE
jgi:hypothetical protein